MRRDRATHTVIGRTIRYGQALFRGRTTVVRDLDGARRNAAAIAREGVRSQGPPRRATVIRASRTLPETFSKKKIPNYPSNFHPFRGKTPALTLI